MSVAPIEPHATDFILVTVITLVLSLLASVLPANVAAKSDPIQSISFQA
jgi:lipoprotein-releasing system permease protein